MKNLLPLSALLILLPLASGFAAQGAPNAQTETPTPVVKTPEPTPAYETVKPGDCADNDDGVKVCNTGDGSEGEDGDFKLDPKSGNGNSKTIIDAQNDAEGTVEGIDGNDTVNCSSGSNVIISGTGGTVNAGSGSTGTVQNTNPPGGASITVNIGGGNISVPPGTTIPFNG